MDLYKIPGVEIFSAGTWNGDTYSEADLDEMVRAFEENKESVRPFLKLGHDDDQKLLQTKGLPAAGWIDKIYRVGEKLVADFVDIPKIVFELIQRKAYRKVSSEIYWNIDIGDKKYSRMLGAVALLGSELPGVMNLSDILAWYSLPGQFAKLKVYNEENKDNDMKVCHFIINEKGDHMTKTESEIKLEMELKDAQEKLEKLSEEQKNYASKNEELAKQLEDAAKAREEAEIKAKEYERKEAQARLESSVEGLLSKKLITPAMKEYMIALLGDEKKEYSFGEKEKEKKMSKFELVEELLKLHNASDVNTEEVTTDGEQGGGTKEDQLNEKIQKYATENKVGYKDAYKAILRETESVVEENQ